jgi:hypothetical protein
MSDGFTGFLKDVADGARWLPIVGTYIGNAAGDDPEHDTVSTAVEDYFLKPGSKPLEKAMHGLSWAYDNGISQPISTYMLAVGANRDDMGELMKGSTWAKAWHVAEHVSPAQAMWADEGHSPWAGDKETSSILENDLLYATPSKSYLPPDWEQMTKDEQQGWLKEVGMPAVGNRAVEEIRRDHSWFTFASGATDFAFRWWLDPAVLAGKGIGAAKVKHMVKPRPQGGWTGDDIESLMADSTMGRAQEFLWANRENPQLINNLSMFRKSGLGPRAGGIISTLKSPEEVNLFLRTSLGDVTARATLQERNALAAYRMEQDTARLSNAELNAERFRREGQEYHALMAENRVDELTRQVNADEALTSRYKATLDHYGELDAINLTRWSFARAERRTRAQADYRTGPALGTAGSRRTPLGTARIYANDFFGPSLTVVRSFAEAHPNGLIAVDDIHPESVAELRGHIARIPGIGSDIRQSLLDGYLKTTTEGERLAQLEKIQGLGVAQVAKKRGFTNDEALTLYREYQAHIVGGQEKLRRYSAGQFPGESVHLDEFLDGGGHLSVHPNLVTRLANDHVMIDLKALDTTLARHGSALKALRTSAVGNPDWMVNTLDWTSHLWKFLTLFRLGYIPRVLGDDLAGQTARLGAATMAVRAGWGVKNLATNLAHWRPASHYQAQEATAREGLKYIDEELKPLTQEAAHHRRSLGVPYAVAERDAARVRERHQRATNALNSLPEDVRAASLRAHQRLVEKRAGDLTRAEAILQRTRGPNQVRLAQLDEQIAELGTRKAATLKEADELKLAKDRGFRQSSQLYRGVEVAPGTVLPAAFAGERGEYFQKMISSDDSLRTLLQRNKQTVHSNLQRAYGNYGVAISYPQDQVKFVQSWHQAINQQIMQDTFALRAVKGASIEDMTRWLTRTPEGRAYRKRLGIKYSPPERLAASVWHEVDEYMPTAEIRAAALEGKADIDFLKSAAEMGRHPFNVHTTQLGESLAGSNHLSRGADRVIDWWYKWAASLPADRMSRHPLFNQLYEGHAKALASQGIAQGAKITQKQADELAEAARRLALKDTRKLVFDIAHRSDTAHMLRFMSPFYAATTEAWQRWARIIADRPQVVGYASVFFNTPISAGWMQDFDGNKLLRDGTVIDPVTGKKRFVPKGERRIMARVPKFIADGPIGKAFGMDSSGNWSISQDSMNLITQGDPFFNPGTGPIVSIPVNEFVKDKPKQAELARHLGVLPFGPTAGSPLFGNTPLGRAADLSMPQTVKNFLTAYDTSDERYQRVKLQIMQKAAYEHAELGKPMPDAREIADMTRNYWLFSAASAFNQPFATQKPDQYQMFRDQYNNLRRKNPLTADEEFLARFDESYFIFAQATSKNKIGAEATRAAVELSQKYEQQLAENPELGALIIGPEGSGPFSPEAYTYQLTHPLVPGGSEMQRTKLSAEEAMKENQRRLGWAKFTQMQNAVTAELHSAGFNSFSDKGAEALKAKRGAITKLYGEPLLPDGSENPYYNEEWSKDFYTFDARKYDRLVPGLTTLAHSDMAQNPNRSDLRHLQTYLAGRKELLAELAARKRAGEAGTLKAKANADLAGTWGRFVDHLREQDTRFGDLHSRYLSRDLGVDVDELTAELDEMSEEVME